MSRTTGHHQGRTAVSVARRLAALALAATLLACSPGIASEDEPARSGGRTPLPASAPEDVSPSPGVDPASGEGGEPAEPQRSRFAGRISTLPVSLAREMRGTTWKPGCPVPLSDLALLRFNYLGFDGEVKRGPLVVSTAVADDVLWVFRQLFEAGFAMKRVGLAREFHPKRWEDEPDSRRDVTASFNCRPVITPGGPQTTVSQHSYGLAVDINPMQNPFVAEDGAVHNRFARPYVDRSKDLVGMIHEGDVVVRSFDAIGWGWGGRWGGGKDYMHFSLLGR